MFYLKVMISHLDSSEPEFDIKFNYKESRARQMEENDDLVKKLVSREHYFQPSKRDEGFIEVDLEKKEYKVDILNTHNQRTVIDRFGEAVFLKDVDTDPVQAAWFNRKPLEIAHIRKPQEGK